MTIQEVVEIATEGRASAKLVIDTLAVHGYVIVPMEATDAMIEAGHKAAVGMSDWPKAERKFYAAAVEARPR